MPSTQACQQQNTPSLTYPTPPRHRILQTNLIAETQPPFNRAILRPKIGEPNLPRARLHRSPIKRSRKEPHRENKKGRRRRESGASVFPLMQSWPLLASPLSIPGTRRLTQPGGWKGGEKAVVVVAGSRGRALTYTTYRRPSCQVFKGLPLRITGTGRLVRASSMQVKEKEVQRVWAKGVVGIR